MHIIIEGSLLLGRGNSSERDRVEPTQREEGRIALEVGQMTGVIEGEDDLVLPAVGILPLGDRQHIVADLQLQPAQTRAAVPYQAIAVRIGRLAPESQSQDLEVGRPLEGRSVGLQEPDEGVVSDHVKGERGRHGGQSFGSELPTHSTDALTGPQTGPVLALGGRGEADLDARRELQVAPRSRMESIGRERHWGTVPVDLTAELERKVEKGDHLVVVAAKIEGDAAEMTTDLH